jgi:hypothetical protein
MVGCVIGSFAVTETVTVSPTFARLGVTLLLAIDIVVRVGAVLSKVTDEASVVDVSVEPGLPAASV